MYTLLTSAQTEFWFHVAEQSQIPIAGVIDNVFNFDSLHSFVRKANDGKQNFEDVLAEQLSLDIDLIDILRTLVGVSNKRLYLELSLLLGRTKLNPADEVGISGDSIFALSKHDTSFFKKLCKEKTPRGKLALIKVAKYLRDKGLERVITSLSKIEPEILKLLVESLIFPKEIQQKEAKRRGHGAEQRLAIVLHELGVNVTPSDRHSDPMRSKDPNVSREDFEIANKDKGSTWSVDLIISGNNKKILIQSLIHTSDPGQYGVNKSDETVTVKHEINIFNQRGVGDHVELWGLVDGFGFSENKKDTIDKMLEHFDCFIQMRTLYKSALRLHELGLTSIKAIKFNDDEYTLVQINEIKSKYVPKDVKVLNLDTDCDPEQFSKCFCAGSAIIYM